MKGKKGWHFDSMEHSLAAYGLKRPNHKLHKIKGLIKKYSREAFKGQNANPKVLFGITGQIAKLKKAG